MDDRESAQASQNLLLAKKAASQAMQIIEMIKSNYNPKRIYQWGSLLVPDQFRDYSDIDIAVEGLEKPEVFFELSKKATSLATFPLDLVELEKIDPLHAEAIRRKGKLVYEQK